MREDFTFVHKFPGGLGRRGLSLLTLGVFALTSSTAWSHEDFSITRVVGKVKVRVTSGFYYEEIKKVWAIGILADRLLTELNQKDTLLLDFVHDYGRPIPPQFYLSVGNGSIDSRGESSWYGLAPMLKDSTAIVIRQRGSSFDVLGELNLIEFAVAQYKTIAVGQKATIYVVGLSPYQVQSIDTAMTRRIANSRPSREVQKVFETKVFRQDDAGRDSLANAVSYVIQRGRYFVFFRTYNFSIRDWRLQSTFSDSTLLDLPNIYQFERPFYGGALIFDTDSTFYYVNSRDQIPEIRRHIIESRKRSLQPFEINRIGWHKIAIWYEPCIERPTGVTERTMIYEILHDQLTQDLEKLLRRN